MLFFVNDYCEGAHEAILKRLMETNMEKVPGYGQDTVLTNIQSLPKKKSAMPVGVRRQKCIC